MAGGDSLWGRLWAHFGSDRAESRARRRALRQIGKSLSSQRPRFYKPRTRELLPALGRFFFDIYATVAGAQSALSGADESATLKSILIESFSAPERKSLRDAISEDAVKSVCEEMNPKDAAKRLAESSRRYFDSFSSEERSRIEIRYHGLWAFVRFARFDYYVILKAFVPGLTEGDAANIPEFGSVEARHLLDRLKDFIECLSDLRLETDWNAIFDLLTVYKGVEVVARKGWTSLLSRLVSISGSGALVDIVRHAEENLEYSPERSIVQHNVFDGYRRRLNEELQTTLRNQILARRKRRIDTLMQSVFGRTEGGWARYYTEEQSNTFRRMHTGGYRYVRAFDRLKGYLVEHFRGEIRRLIGDVVIVRGEWVDDGASSDLSDSYHRIMDLTRQLVDFDEDLVETGERGRRIRQASIRVVTRDPGSARALVGVLGEIDTHVGEMINRAGRELIAFATQMKALVEDRGRRSPQMIQNWQQLESAHEGPLRNALVVSYKRLHSFLVLLKMSLQA